MTSSVFAVFFCWLSLQAMAQEIQPPFDVQGGGGYAQSKDRDANEKPSEWGGVPAVFRTPETGLGIGGVIIFVPSGTTKKVSSLLGGAVITDRNQIFSAVYGEKYFLGDQWVGELYSSFQEYPDLFYGIGAHTRLEDGESYTWKQRQIASSMRYLFTDDFRAGLNAVISDDNFTDLKDTGLLKTASRGVEGGRSLGLGGSMRWDTTDDAYSPGSGEVVNILYMDYARRLSGEYGFRSLEVNLKKYWTIASKDHLAAQIYLLHNMGQTPFYLLAKLGGKNLLRGYFLGRYRDQSMLVSQLEYRRHFWGPWAGVAFAGVGNVGPTLSQLVDETPKPSVGFGGRYKLVQRQNINVRLDCAFAPKEANPSIYLYILEAF